MKNFIPVYQPNILGNEKKYVLNGLRYILSGGLNFKQLFPSFLSFLLILFEVVFSPVAKHWAPFRIIVIKKLS